MNSDKILFALGCADDELIAASMPQDGTARKHWYNSRGLKAAVIAIAVLLIGGTVAYATGILTAPFNLYRSKEVSTKTRILTIDGVEVDFIDVDVKIPVISEKEITGPIRDDAAELLKDKQDKDERDWSWGRSSEDEPWVKVYDDFYQIQSFKVFDNQAELLDYIGCRYYEPQYFPYDKMSAGVQYSAMLKDDKVTIDCTYSMSSVDERIRVYTWTECGFVSGKVKNGTFCNTGIGGFGDDGSTTVELFSNPNGYNGAKACANEGCSSKYEQYFITGCVVKNNCFYEININCDWADKAEADRIFDTWANSF